MRPIGGKPDPLNKLNSFARELFLQRGGCQEDLKMSDKKLAWH